MKRILFNFNFQKVTLSVALAFASFGSYAQTNVYDDVIATSANHTSLKAALDQEGLDVALQNGMATYTVFAPDNAAFNDLATALNTDINGLLALPNLSDILLYHVLGVTVDAAGVTNGAIVDALNTDNTIKLTKTSMGAVYANQAMVNGADLTTDNGIVHSVDAVILPYETVVDIAIDNGFTSLTTAVVTAELLPALTDPLATFTVFAPDNAAFDDLAAALSTDINGLLALPNLADILLYHVLGTEVDAAAVTNGAIVDPLNTSNTVKMTKTSMGDVYANQAQVSIADITADNGIVHAIDAVILPYETVVDVAIDNGFSTLTTAVITAELLPALTDPLASYTVFAPDNTAFDNLAADLGTDLNGILALPNLADILLYHVVGSEVTSGDLVNGPVTMLNGGDINVDLTSGVMINNSNVTLADVTADNGVVHVIDAVLIESTASIEEESTIAINMYPNPTSDVVNFEFETGVFETIEIVNLNGQVVVSLNIEENENTLNVQDLESGQYLVTFKGTDAFVQKNLLINKSK